MITTAPTGVDTSAPIVTRHVVDIDAPPEVAQQLLTDLPKWPSWNHDITAMQPHGEFRVGDSFTWTSYDFTVTSTVYSVETGRILWGGTANGITGVHEWRFEPYAGGTRVTTTESFAGDAVEAQADQWRDALAGSLESWLAHLKTAAENTSSTV